jgi:hypothetical protein
MTTSDPSSGSGGEGPTRRGHHAEVCLCWIENDTRLCSLPRFHTGSHLSFPNWPQQDVSASNPSAPKGRAA